MSGRSTRSCCLPTVCEQLYQQPGQRHAEGQHNPRPVRRDRLSDAADHGGPLHRCMPMDYLREVLFRQTPLADVGAVYYACVEV